MQELENLIKVITKLRDPVDGCPWDLEQNHQTLTKYMIEEAYEYIHAVEQNDIQEMKEELGDVLLQVVLNSIIAEQEGNFTLEEVAKTLADKMIRRHPHVFGDQDDKSIEGIKTRWEEIKSAEKKEKKVETLIGDDVLALPALSSSNKIGKKTKKIRFDWDNADQVREKVEEEWTELKFELDKKEKGQELIEEEFGDFLFTCAQLGRHLNIDPERALRKANQKFLRRFRSMEALINKEQLEIDKMNQEEMDVFWNQVKKNEKN